MKEFEVNIIVNIEHDYGDDRGSFLYNGLMTWSVKANSHDEAILNIQASIVTQFRKFDKLTITVLDTAQ